jgi:hypothetical protein
MTTIITPAEAIRFSPVDNDFPVSRLYGQIKAEEWLVFVEHIGEDFYTRLLADLVDYSGVDQWNGGPYAVGAHAMDAGMVYTSLIADNTEPIGDPLNASAWKEADKFSTACFNDLWTKGFLREYLAYTVILPAVAHATYPVGAAGMVQKYEDATGIRSAANPNYGKVIDELQRGKHMRLSLLSKYMSDNAGTCDFSGSLFAAGCGIVNAGPGRTRRTFYRS